MSASRHTCRSRANEYPSLSILIGTTSLSNCRLNFHSDFVGRNVSIVLMNLYCTTTFKTCVDYAAFDTRPQTTCLSYWMLFAIALLINSFYYHCMAKYLFWTIIFIIRAHTYSVCRCSVLLQFSVIDDRSWSLPCLFSNNISIQIIHIVICTSFITYIQTWWNVFCFQEWLQSRNTEKKTTKIANFPQLNPQKYP